MSCDDSRKVHLEDVNNEEKIYLLQKDWQLHQMMVPSLKEKKQELCIFLRERAKKKCT